METSKTNQPQPGECYVMKFNGAEWAIPNGTIMKIISYNLDEGVWVKNLEPGEVSWQEKPDFIDINTWHSARDNMMIQQCKTPTYAEALGCVAVSTAPDTLTSRPQPGEDYIVTSHAINWWPRGTKLHIVKAPVANIRLANVIWTTKTFPGQKPDGYAGYLELATWEKFVKTGDIQQVGVNSEGGEADKPAEEKKIYDLTEKERMNNFFSGKGRF